MVQEIVTGSPGAKPKASARRGALRGVGGGGKGPAAWEKSATDPAQYYQRHGHCM